MRDGTGDCDQHGQLREIPACRDRSFHCRQTRKNPPHGGFPASAEPAGAAADEATMTAGPETIMIDENERATLGKAWTEYCDALRLEGERIIAGEAGDARDGNELAEALRAVARIGIMSLQHR